MRTSRRRFVASASASVALLAAGVAHGRKGKYDEGASDTEIRIGNICAYSGPASAYGALGRGYDAYWKMVNDRGGINGRKIRFISLDDGYSPPKTVEAARQLVEQDKVLLLFAPLGTACNTAIQKYMNAKRVPQLFVATGASKWGKPKAFPWTMGWTPDYHTEAVIYASHILSTVKDARIAVLMQNDDYGKDYYEGFREGLHTEVGRIVKHVAYEVTDPTVDSQVIQLSGSDANVFFNIASPKAAAQAIRKVADIGWKPVHYLNNVSTSVAAVIKPAGYANSQGILSAFYRKDPTDQRFANDDDVKVWRAWMETYVPGGNLADFNFVTAYSMTYTLHKVLESCGDDLTRANVMKQAASLRNFEVPMLLPGIRINTSPTDFYPIQAIQMVRFKGESWEVFGGILSNESS